MELQVIPLAAMWPDPNNPRKDFGDLDALADTFEMNAVRPMEPVNPPIVVPDGVSARGQMFRIVDGERRWRAMVKRAAVESCAAIVCSMDEANAMAAMVATDDKAQLTDAELSRGVQQMLAVGVAPEEVDKAARLKRGTARRVARVAREGTEQLSIGHLLAAEEFDDADARELVLSASEDRWEEEAARIRRMAKRESDTARLVELCGSLGVEMADSRPDGYKMDGWYYPDKLEAHGEFPPGAVAVLDASQYRDANVDVYVPAAAAEEAEPDPEAEAARAESERVGKLAESASSARSEWLVRQIYEREDFCGDMMPIVEAYRAASENPSGPYTYRVMEWMGDHGIAGKIVETGHVVVAFIEMNRRPFESAPGECPKLREQSARRWASLGCAMRSLGYRPSPDEVELDGMIAEAIDALEKTDENEEEEDDR